MDFQNMNIWCWLIPALVGIICVILGYLWGKGSVEVIDNSAEIKSLKEKSDKLEADLVACNKRLAIKTAPVIPIIPLNPFDSFAAKAAFGKAVKQDDLKVVEGIGPKVEQLFHSFDIKTWKAVAECSVASCQEVLDSGGEHYRIHDPASWPMQAKMCYENKWANLKKWQDEHLGGKF